MNALKTFIEDSRAAMHWLEKTLMLLGIVFIYQFVSLNFFGRGVSYNTEVLRAYAEQAVAEALEPAPRVLVRK